MQTKTLKTPLGEFSIHPFSGENTTGYQPFGERILVLPDQPSVKTEGGILLTEETKERVSMAAETGIVVAVGEEAWKWNADRTRPFEGRKPKVGDRIYFERYAGQVLHGDDGALYRVMDDKAIAAIRAPD